MEDGFSQSGVWGGGEMVQVLMQVMGSNRYNCT